MIKGTKGMDDLIKMMKTSNYQDFLKTKLKYFADS
jgi:hypothetical protein